MKIIVIGAGGTIGSAVAEALNERGHDVVRASRSGDVTVDLTDPASIAGMFEQVGQVDAVASVAGAVPFVHLTEASLDDYKSGLADKTLGQIELVRQGQHVVADGGSFTLVSGVLNRDPILTGTMASVANGAIDAFVEAAAYELPRGQRINVVSPEVIEEAWESYAPFFPGHTAVPAAVAARAYVKSIEGHQTGQVYRVGY